MIYEDDNTLVLSCSGKKIYAYGGVVGIDPTATYVGGGHDNEIDWKLARDEFRAGELSGVTADEFLTPEERIELASEMLQRWGTYLNEARTEQHHE